MRLPLDPTIGLEHLAVTLDMFCMEKKRWSADTASGATPCQCAQVRDACHYCLQYPERRKSCLLFQRGTMHCLLFVLNVVNLKYLLSVWKLTPRLVSPVSINTLMLSAIGKCDQNSLPKIDNGQREQVRKLRGAVHKYSCNKGFNLIGDDLVYCKGNEWSLTSPPLCASESKHSFTGLL